MSKKERLRLRKTATDKVFFYIHFTEPLASKMANFYCRKVGKAEMFIAGNDQLLYTGGL